MCSVLWFLCLLSILSINCIAYEYRNENEGPLARIRRYAKRQVAGNCLYNMCNDTEAYPENEIKQLIEKDSRFMDLFGTVVAPYKTVVPAIQNRVFGEEENMCNTESILMFPQKALDINDVWQTIVNVENYRQVVHFEACSQEAKCYAQSHMPRGYETSCATQSISIRMIAVNQEGALKLEQFPLPAGCFCKYKFDYTTL